MTGTTESIAPGESVTATSTGNDPERSPYELTVSLASQALTVELKLDECPSYDGGFSIASDGALSVEREVRQERTDRTGEGDAKRAPDTGTTRGDVASPAGPVGTTVLSGNDAVTVW